MGAMKRRRVQCVAPSLFVLRCAIQAPLVLHLFTVLFGSTLLKKFAAPPLFPSSLTQSLPHPHARLVAHSAPVCCLASLTSLMGLHGCDAVKCNSIECGAMSTRVCGVAFVCERIMHGPTAMDLLCRACHSLRVASLKFVFQVAVFLPFRGDIAFFLSCVTSKPPPHSHPTTPASPLACRVHYCERGCCSLTRSSMSLQSFAVCTRLSVCVVSFYGIRASKRDARMRCRFSCCWALQCLSATLCPPTLLHVCKSCLQ